ncbi:peptidoglycan DD-metalloendopeptidase family protein [Kamptonema sp. UHCC 0994]|uniref:peptidoglycan DD-metalloendopeptidase family protein n=1 Tax=Kamptonema sp. UHCC 0994 TaxID=3031329 RepID=UPI0023B9FA71|nr:peptidoglycan DD-metalloendopeptidase family protein [Kamptonema sp. UHCC 0994]MDF0553572.1 peptidoglycan DD-metalloendopeptidase family protein [Kamptonema sp. UHCC 0994]
MKRTNPDKMNFVDAREINIDGTAEPSKQATGGTGRVRSAAMIGLAISVGASSLLLPTGGDAAAAADSVSAETTEMQPTPLGIQSNVKVEDEAAHPLAARFNSDLVKVRKGQTLWELSQDYEVDPNTLAKANGIKSDSLLQVGQQLKVPSLNVISSDAKTGNTVATLPSQTRYVDTEQEFKSNQTEQLGQQSREAIAPNRSQESLSTRSYQTQLESEEPGNLSESRLENTNGLTQTSGTPLLGNETATAPQTLPAVPTDKFDAFGSSSQTVFAPVPAIESAEPVVTPNATGTVVIEPDGTAPAPSSVLYRVRMGDTLDAIAENYGISVADVIAANQIADPHYLTLNQALKIPQIQSHRSGEQAATVISGSTSTTTQPVAETPSPLMSAESAAPSSGVAETAPTVSVISSLTNAEGASSVSVPTVAKINSISLAPLATAGVSNQGKSALNAQPKFTGAFGQIPVSTNHQGSMESFAPTTEPTSSARELAVENTTAALPSPVPVQKLGNEVVTVNLQTSTSANSPNPYADRLRSEITRLREEYRADRNNQQEPRATSTTAFVSNTQLPTTEANHSNSIEPINPEFNPQRYAQAVQNEISTPQSRQWAQQLQRQQQKERANPERAFGLAPVQPSATSGQPLVATAPLGADAYDPLSNPSLGRMVSPELPPLPGAETYLPAGSMPSKGFIWPAKGVLSSGYGWRWGRMHKGIDIAGDIGTPIVAADAGVVTYAAWNDGGYGYLVEVTHPNGSVTLYGHNNRILVQEGQRVAQGQQISEMGSTGFSTGPHLHFEIHPSGQGAVNPMAFLPDDSRSASQ